MYFEFLFIFSAVYLAYTSIGLCRKYWPKRELINRRIELIFLGGVYFHVIKGDEVKPYQLAGIEVPGIGEPFGLEAFNYLECLEKHQTDFIVPVSEGSEIVLGIKYEGEWLNVAELLLYGGLATPIPGPLYAQYLGFQNAAKDQKRGMYTNVVQLRVGNN